MKKIRKGKRGSNSLETEVPISHPTSKTSEHSFMEEEKKNGDDRDRSQKKPKKNLKIIIPKNKELEGQMELLKMMNDIHRSIPASNLFHKDNE